MGNENETFAIVEALGSAADAIGREAAEHGHEHRNVMFVTFAGAYGHRKKVAGGTEWQHCKTERRVTRWLRRNPGFKS